MSFTLGNNFKVSLFGESHGPMIGVTIDGIAPGIEIDFNYIDEQLLKRRPQSNVGTKRVELDKYQVVSGIFEGVTTGTPLTFLIENKDHKSEDYHQLENYYRPSHADYSGEKKYLGFNDIRGGGAFSGRLTVAVVIAGAIAQQILRQKDIKIASKVIQVQDIEDIGFRSEEKLFDMQVDLINENVMPAVCPKKAQEIYDLVTKTGQKGDSLGAKMQTQVMNVEAGIGEPYFDGLDAKISQALFSIGAIKGVEFGSGFELANMLGSEGNDQYDLADGKIITITNHAGGIVGGISNGEPLVINTVVKPTPSITKSQQSVHKELKKVEEITIEGRHDPAIFPRISVVLNSVVAFVLVDAYSERYGYLWQRGA